MLIVSISMIIVCGIALIGLIIYGVYINIKSYLFQREARLFQNELREYWNRHCKTRSGNCPF